MLALAISVLLAAPTNCPPAVGQIKWDDFSFSFKARGKRFEVAGPLWDRDRNGRPSKGDLFRVDSTSRGAADETWVLVGRGLARSMQTSFKRTKNSLNAVCEARFEIKGVPKVSSAGALGKLLLRQGGGKVDPIAALDASMRGWADDICGKRRHVEESALAKILGDRARSRMRGYTRRTINGQARKVAKDYALQCAHLAMPKVTFD